ncbi:hypothetical protein, partial [Comamonas sp.]|uniref:hypothetical protein n=1 Tax=Comamonas sp. TaxID=34028 RepID=UPI0026478DF8
MKSMLLKPGEMGARPGSVHQGTGHRQACRSQCKKQPDPPVAGLLFASWMSCPAGSIEPGRVRLAHERSVTADVDELEQEEAADEPHHPV